MYIYIFLRYLFEYSSGDEFRQQLRNVMILYSQVFVLILTRKVLKRDRLSEI